MNFLSCKIRFSDILYLWKWLSEWADDIDIEPVSIYKEFPVVLNDIYFIILSSQKCNFDEASIMTGERLAASLLDVISFLLGNPDVGLSSNWRLL